MRRSKEQLQLIKRIEVVNPEAAKYLRSKQVQKLSSYTSSAKSLMSTFIFSETPQGFDYWYDVVRKIRERP